MSQTLINVSTPNDGLGDKLRRANVITNENFTELYSLKVSKVTGYDLSKNDFTDYYKSLLDNPIGQVQTDWNEGSVLSKAYLKNKPTNLSAFFNDTAFITDVPVSGIFARSNGSWKDLTVKIKDGFIGVTAGMAVAQNTFTLPAGSVCIDVYLSHSKQYKTTANNASLVNRWSQNGNDVILTNDIELNNYLYIEYT